MAVETTLLVDFGDSDGADSIVVFELDDELNADTTFNPGDDVFLRVQVSSNVSISSIVATHGDVRSYGSENVTKSDYVDFLTRSENPSYNIGYVSPSIISTSYLGRSGSISYSQKVNGSLDLTGSSSLAPYKALIQYNITYLSYILNTPTVSLAEGETYPITVVLYVDIEGDDECNGN